MSAINLSVKHGQSQEEARAGLERAVGDACSRFGAMVQRVEWSPDRNRVKIVGSGFEARLHVDPVEVHADVDVPFLNGILGSLVNTGLKQILQRNFPMLPKQ